MNILPINFDQSPFEKIKHIDEQGFEFWYARELQLVLNYKQWRRFNDVILLAQENLETVVESVLDHIASIGNLVNRPQGGGNAHLDYKLSRLACYHVALCCDSRGNDAVKMAKHYFAVKTRQAEVGQINSPQVAKPTEPEAIISLLDKALSGVDLKTELLAGIKLNIIKTWRGKTQSFRAGMRRAP